MTPAMPRPLQLIENRSAVIPVLLFMFALFLAAIAVTTAEAAEIPANAYSSNASYGKTWQCHRGYIAKGDSCVEIAVPEHAYLRSSSERWHCERVYRKERETCIAITVPAHGILSDSTYSSGWA